MGYIIDLQPAIGPALVVGGGPVAARKVRGLIEAGFAVHVVAPSIDAAISGLNGVTCETRDVRLDDVPGHGIVLACTDDRETNRLIGERARILGIPVVVADSVTESTAYSMATVRLDGFTIAVSSGGIAPGAAATVRDRVAAMLEDEPLPARNRKGEHPASPA